MLRTPGPGGLSFDDELARIALEDLAPDTIRRAAALARQGYAAASRARMLAEGLCRWLAAEGHLAQDPTMKQDRPRPPARRRRSPEPSSRRADDQAGAQPPLRRWLLRAGVSKPEGEVAHAFRHTYAKGFVSRGVPPGGRAGLGHASL